MEKGNANVHRFFACKSIKSLDGEMEELLASHKMYFLRSFSKSIGKLFYVNRKKEAN